MKTQLFRMSALVLAAMMLITACGGATPTTGPTQTPVVMEVTRIVAGTPVVETVIVTATPPPAEPEKPFRVAVVMPSSTTDT